MLCPTATRLRVQSAAFRPDQWLRLLAYFPPVFLEAANGNLHAFIPVIKKSEISGGLFRFFKDWHEHPQQATEEQGRGTKKSNPAKSKRKRRWSGHSRSRHSFETCLKFVMYQKKVLGRRGIYDPEGLAGSLYNTASQDDEISDFIDAQANAA